MKPSYLTVGRNRRTFVTPSLESRSIAITTHPTNYTVLNHCKLFTHIYTHHKPFSNSILSLSFLLFYTQSLISPLPLSLYPNPIPPILSYPSLPTTRNELDTGTGPIRGRVWFFMDVVTRPCLALRCRPAQPRPRAIRPPSCHCDALQYSSHLTLLLSELHVQLSLDSFPHTKIHFLLLILALSQLFFPPTFLFIFLILEN